MLDPIVNFFTWIFQWIGRGIGFLIGIILWPFMWFGRWYTQRGWILKAVLGVAIVGLVGLYVYFIWTTQRWSNFDPAYAAGYTFAPPAGAKGGGDRRRHRRSGQDLHDLGHRDGYSRSPRFRGQPERLDLVDAALQARPLRRGLGPHAFLDNKAAFQRGVHQAIRRTAVELVDTIGRVRGTSQIDQSLQDARGAVEFDEETWYFGLRPFGPKTPKPELLPHSHSVAARLQRPPAEMRGGVQRARRQPGEVRRPHRQRPRFDRRHHQQAGADEQRRLVRYARGRSLLVRLRPALRVPRHPESDAPRLQEASSTAAG